jgi:transglutaminase-like putative cysteine protease
MRIAIRHRTTYEYGAPANSALQILRLTPRSHGGQFVRRWRIDLDADCRLEKDLDALGNITHTFHVDGPITALSIDVEGEVDTSDTTGFVRGTAERFPAAFWTRETELTRPDAAIRTLGQDSLAGEGGDRLAALHALMQAIHRDMVFDTDATHPSTTAAEAWRLRKGVCQDFAQVFCAAARSIGVPARYVSGYYLRTDTDEQTAGHAWAEAAIPDIGWIGFDPAHGLCINERYVRVAVGPDAIEAAPIRGTRAGGVAETLSVAVTVAKGRSFVEE